MRLRLTIHKDLKMTNIDWKTRLVAAVATCAIHGAIMLTAIKALGDVASRSVGSSMPAPAAVADEGSLRETVGMMQ